MHCSDYRPDPTPRSTYRASASSARCSAPDVSSAPLGRYVGERPEPPTGSRAKSEARPSATLDKAIARIIKAYDRLALPKCWRDTKRASPDGTKWTPYGQNLLTEYHVRYGGYGGIGYYHMSEMYIALGGHFIPCGERAVIDLFTSRSVRAGKKWPKLRHLCETQFETRRFQRRQLHAVRDRPDERQP